MAGITIQSAWVSIRFAGSVKFAPPEHSCIMVLHAWCAGGEISMGILDGLPSSQAYTVPVGFMRGAMPLEDDAVHEEISKQSATGDAEKQSATDCLPANPDLLANDGVHEEISKQSAADCFPANPDLLALDGVPEEISKQSATDCLPPNPDLLAIDGVPEEISAQSASDGLPANPDVTAQGAQGCEV